MMSVIAGQDIDRILPNRSDNSMPQTPQTPEQLLDLAEPGAASSVRIARKAIGEPARIETQRQRWRRLSTTLTASAPILLGIIIGGSLIQTGSPLIETVWIITAAGILLAGIAIAVAYSRSYYLNPLDATNTPTQDQEVQQLIKRSAYAKAWHEFITREARGVHQFDLEIMWALATQELGKPADEEDTH